METREIVFAIRDGLAEYGYETEHISFGLNDTFFHIKLKHRWLLAQVGDDFVGCFGTKIVLADPQMFDKIIRIVRAEERRYRETGDAAPDVRTHVAIRDFGGCNVRAGDSCRAT